MTCEEYDLLLRLNQIAIAKYNDMSKLSSGLTEVAQRLNDKCKLVNYKPPRPPTALKTFGNNYKNVLYYLVVSLQDYCDQIDQVDSKVSELEQTAYRLDSYAKQLGNNFYYNNIIVEVVLITFLEAKFKAIEKR